MVLEIDNIDTIKRGNVLVDFYTTTCQPCRMLAPVLEEISQEYQNIKVAKIEVTRNPDASQMFGIMSVPTLMFMTDSQVKEVQRGFSNKQSIKDMINRNVES